MSPAQRAKTGPAALLTATARDLREQAAAAVPAGLTLPPTIAVALADLLAAEGGAYGRYRRLKDQWQLINIGPCGPLKLRLCTEWWDASGRPVPGEPAGPPPDEPQAVSPADAAAYNDAYDRGVDDAEAVHGLGEEAHTAGLAAVATYARETADARLGEAVAEIVGITRQLNASQTRARNLEAALAEAEGDALIAVADAGVFAALRAFAAFVVELDEPGNGDRRTITLSKLIEMARRVLPPEPPTPERNGTGPGDIRTITDGAEVVWAPMPGEPLRLECFGCGREIGAYTPYYLGVRLAVGGDPADRTRACTDCFARQLAKQPAADGFAAEEPSDG